MAATVNEIRAAIETVYPPRYAMSWDNPGLLVGHGDKIVSRILVALDATDEVIKEAVETGAQLIVTHHPMIFKSVSRINDESAIGRRILDLVRSDISYYAMHTNFDAAPEGMGMLVARRMGVLAEGPMERMTEASAEGAFGIGFVGELAEEAKSAKQLAERIKEAFQIPSVVYYDGGKAIKRVAVCPGSGRGMYAYAKAAHADAFITGDMGHHDGIDAVEDGMTLIDAGHFGLEHVFVDFMTHWLSERFPSLAVYGNLTDERKTV